MIIIASFFNKRLANCWRQFKLSSGGSETWQKWSITGESWGGEQNRVFLNETKKGHRDFWKLYLVVCFCLKKLFFFKGEIVVSFFGVAWKSKFFWICGTKLVERVVCLEVSRGSFPTISRRNSPQTILWFFVLSFPDSSRTILTPTIGFHHLNEAMAASSLLCGTFLGLLLAGLVTWIYGRGAGRIMQLIQVDFRGFLWGLRVRV